MFYEELSNKKDEESEMAYIYTNVCMYFVQTIRPVMSYQRYDQNADIGRRIYIRGWKQKE